MHTRKNASNVGEATLTSAKTLLQWLDDSSDISYICLFHEHVNTKLLTEKGKGRPRKEMFPPAIHNSNGTAISVPMGEHCKSDIEIKEFEQEMQPLRQRLRVGSKFFGCCMG